MTSPRWMILVCFSLISVFGTGESFAIIVPEENASVDQSSLPAIIDEMTKAISDLNASHKKLLGQQKGILCLCTKYQNDGWQYFRGSLYYMSTTTANLQTSRNYCLSNGADFVIINDAAENNFARGFKQGIWLRLYKEGSNWRWMDGSYLSSNFSFWIPKEPNNNGGREDRVEIQYFNNFNCWNDSPQTNNNYWICEKKVV